VIGRIPDSGALAIRGARGNVRDQDAFGMLRAQLRYFDVDREIRRVIVTSADAGDGKTLVALNLARAAVRADDRRVLVIEADMRRPGLTRAVGLDSVAGLAELLSHSQEMSGALHQLVLRSDTVPAPGWSDDPAAFDLLLAGTVPPNPAELLEGARMTELLEYVESAYDLVIIDTPPIGVVSDAIPLVHKVDGIMVVSRVNHSRRDHALRLVKQLRDLNAHILGLVVNGAEAAGSGGYYGYSEPAGDGGGRAARGATSGQ
jgi:capsular exopolysaccharide synthesis family protein